MRSRAALSHQARDRGRVRICVGRQLIGLERPHVERSYAFDGRVSPRGIDRARGAIRNADASVRIKVVAP